MDKVSKSVIERYIKEACEMATISVYKNSGPFGCIITDMNFKEITRGHNMVSLNKDPTAHAEIVTIRKACEILDNHELSDCILFSSCEPCPMCLSAIYWSKIKYVYYANTRDDAKIFGFDDSFIYEEVNKDIKNRSIKMKKIYSSNALDSFVMWYNKDDKKIEWTPTVDL